jgi:hypothetical protein
VWALTRAITTGLFLALAQTQGATYWTGPKPNYWDYLNIWDAEWFEDIFSYGFGGDRGYLSLLPADDAGYVAQNDWAFLPGFPFLARWLSFGYEWKFVAPTLTLVLSFGLALVVYRLAILQFEAQTAIWSVALLGLMPPSLIFQAGYADTLGLLLLALTLGLIVQRRYLWALLPIAAFSLTRPGTFALALAAAAIWVWRFRQARNQGEEFRLSERIRLALLAALSTGLGFLWSGIAWFVTGFKDAYLASELAWRISFLSERRFVPFVGWEIAPAYFWGSPHGPWIMYVLIVVAVLLVLLPPADQLAIELRIWVLSFFVYLYVFFFPQSSTFRILLMAFPMVIALAWLLVRVRRRWRWMVVVALVPLQWWWLWECWRYAAPDFSPP